MKNKLENATPRHKAWRYFLGYMPLILGNSLLTIKISGRSNIPEKSPYIVVANHFSTTDPFFVIAGLLRPITFLMASDQEVETHLAWAPKLYGYIPTDRKNLKPGTIKNALKALKNGEILGLFPEGDTYDNKLRPAKRGAAYLAGTAGVPILPMSILGAEDLWDNLFRGVRPVVEVKIGKRINLCDREYKHDKKETLDKAGEIIMNAIADLLPEERRRNFGTGNDYTIST